MNKLQHFDWPKMYQGARWVRVDLHLHSPGSHTFSLPNGLDPVKDRERIADLYVQKLVEQDIQVAAITDYQGPREEWFQIIQEKAAAKGIVVFPGAELSFKGPKYGLHILAIFAHDTDPADILRVVHALDKDPAVPLIRADGSHRDIDPKENIKSVLMFLRTQFEPSPLLIVAHPNDSNGLLKSFRSRDAAEFIREVHPDAIEDGLSAKDVERLTNTGVLHQADLERIARVRFSDPKRIEEIGTKTKRDGSPRATWLKLSVLDDLNALRLALHDPQILVHLGEPPHFAYTRLLGMEVDGNGFLGELSLAFSPELNTLVGGRGVGKSAILETIRYTLDLPLYMPTEYRESLVRHALGSGGKAVLYVEQVVGSVTRRYRIERVWGESPYVYELTDTGEQMVDLAPLDILGEEVPLFFGQREIYEVSRDATKRLRLLDEIIGREARQQILQGQKLEQRLRENAREILRLRRQLEEEEEIEHRLKEIRHEIALYRREGLVEKLREATALAADEERLRQAKEALERAVDEWNDLTYVWVERWTPPRRVLGEAESSQKDLLQQAQKVFFELEQRISTLFQQGRIALEQAQASLQNIMQQWEEAKRPLDEVLRKAKQDLGSEVLDPDRLVKLTEEQTRLEPQLRQLKQIRAEVERLEREREALLRQLREARREVWRLRSQRAEALTAQLQGRVRIHVEYKGERKAFLERLKRFFQGSGVDKKTLERLALFEGIDGETIVQIVRKGPEVLAEKFNLTSGRAQQIYSYLIQDAGRLFELELMSPDDAVRVELKINEMYHPLEKLSDGQRATAMLLLLLVQEDRGLIVDQPEDDLDNRFIYEDIVRILRAQKGKRQILVATHNPNIPVLGHAELIVALEATESKASIAALGALDRLEIQKFVKDVMEGGEDAFRRRAEKYGWL